MMKPKKIVLTKMGAEKEPELRKDPPPAWMPPESFFKAEFLGSDTLNFIYIRTADTGSVQNYTNLQNVMAKTYGKLPWKKNLPPAEIIPDSYIVLKEELYYHRAKVTRKNDDLGLIYCHKIDEGTCAVAVARQIFPISEDILKIPCCTIRCKLQGMDFFDDLPHLELGYQLIKMSEIMSRPLYSVQVLGIVDNVPYISLSRYGSELANAVQKFIPVLCTPQVPQKEIPFKGEIMYANMKANVWIRQYGDDGLFGKISETLQRYKTTMDVAKQERALAKQSLSLKGYAYSRSGGSGSMDHSVTPPNMATSGDNSDNPDFFLTAEEMWKEKYFESPDGIFVSEHLDELYRVRVVRKLQANKVEVEFIDFGNKQVLHPKKLIPIRKVDQNLAFIPPQCLKARLQGFYRMNTFFFWRLLPQPFSIMVKSLRGDEEYGIEIDIVGPGPQGTEKDCGFSLSETWRASSPDKLALCILKPVEMARGAKAGPRQRQDKSEASEGYLTKRQGALYKKEGLAVNPRLRRLTLEAGARWR